MFKFKEFFESVDLSGYQNDPKFIQSVFDNVDWSGGDGDHFRMYAKLELYDDPYYSEDEEDYDAEEVEELALEKGRGYIENRLNDLIWQYDNFEEPLRLWREITVVYHDLEEAIKNIRLLGVGVYWAHTSAAAEAHWGNFTKGSRKLTLYAEVPSHMVNWRSTLLNNLHTTLGEDEKEIQLKSSVQVNIKKILVGNKWYDVNFSAFA